MTDMIAYMILQNTFLKKKIKILKYPYLILTDGII